MAVIHISEAEASRDLAEVIAKARAGEHIVIESGDEAYALIPWNGAFMPPAGLAISPPPRKLSEAIRRAEERGSTVTLDDQFGSDLEEVIRAHQREALIDPWESF